MEEKLAQLKQLLAEISDLGEIESLLGWDMQTYMPPGGSESRSYQMSTIARLMHEMFTGEKVGQLLEDLRETEAQLPADSDDARMLKLVRREYQKNTRIPAEMVAEFVEVTAKAHEVWQTARQNNDFAAFQPYLERIVALRQQQAHLFAPFDHIYDPLLDDFEPGMLTKDVQAIFQTLRTEQVELIKAIAARPQVNDDFLHVNYPEKAQWDFGVDVITKFGYDWSRGRQDKSVHPFTTSFGSSDVRITTRFDPERSASALFSTMHEAGHALYEQGLHPRFSRTFLARAASLAVHESQSRMWENLVGRSLPFWTHFYPKLQQAFGAQLDGVDLTTFYKGINRVEPSLIRVEADEATYNLHIMLRLELEIALMDGSLAVKDLPEAWNDRCEDYLGIRPTNDRDGVLQDVHWSGGSIGYFPTYALGNLISVQLWEKMNADLPGLEDDIRNGQFAALLDWLRTHVHQHGAKYEPQELVQMITGSKIDPHPYLRYLKTKYSEIYGL